MTGLQFVGGGGEVESHWQTVAAEQEAGDTRFELTHNYAPRFMPIG
jgi:hypothetical protein